MDLLQVVRTKVCNTAQTLCNSIAPVYHPSLAIVELNNTGNSNSSYTITVDNCTHPVVPVPLMSLELAPNVVQNVSFEVCFQDHLSIRLTPYKLQPLGVFS